MTRKLGIPLIVDEPEMAAILAGQTQIGRPLLPEWWGIDAPLYPFGRPGDRLFAVTIKRIPGWQDKYGAGDDGHIYRLDRPRPEPIAGCVKSTGYLNVSLCGHGIQHSVGVHILVCKAFYGLPSSGFGPRPEARHLDGDRNNNLPENLDWGTASQNWADRKAHGRGVHEEHHNAKLSMAIAEEIRASALTVEQAARRYGVVRGAIQHIRNGRTWVAPERPPINAPRWSDRVHLEVRALRLEQAEGAYRWVIDAVRTKC